MYHNLFLKKMTVSQMGIPLFHPVSLTLTPGEACEVLGPNGVGKTSLLELLIRTQTNKVDGSFVPDSVFYLSTKKPFDSHETVEVNLSFWKNLWGTSTDCFQESLETWRLKPLLKLPYAHLSQGQKQRVNLVRLSFKKSSLWLLDEPTSNLDQENCLLFKKILDQHLREGGMALIATHDSFGISKNIVLEKQLFQKEKSAA